MAHRDIAITMEERELLLSHYLQTCEELSLHSRFLLEWALETVSANAEDEDLRKRLTDMCFFDLSDNKYNLDPPLPPIEIMISGFVPRPPMSTKEVTEKSLLNTYIEDSVTKKQEEEEARRRKREGIEDDEKKKKTAFESLMERQQAVLDGKKRFVEGQLRERERKIQEEYTFQPKMVTTKRPEKRKPMTLPGPLASASAPSLHRQRRKTIKQKPRIPKKKKASVATEEPSALAKWRFLAALESTHFSPEEVLEQYKDWWCAVSGETTLDKAPMFLSDIPAASVDQFASLLKQRYDIGDSTCVRHFFLTFLRFQPSWRRSTSFSLPPTSPGSTSPGPMPAGPMSPGPMSPGTTIAQGELDFKTFVDCISRLQRGTPEEKLEFSFHSFDLDNNGYIERAEVFKLLTSLSPSTSVSDILFAVQTGFREMDIDHDGRISKDEWISRAKDQPILLRYIESAFSVSDDSTGGQDEEDGEGGGDEEEDEEGEIV